MQHTYTGWDRKPAYVEGDGDWYYGELRSWDQADDGTWSGIGHLAADTRRVVSPTDSLRGGCGKRLADLPPMHHA